MQFLNQLSPVWRTANSGMCDSDSCKAGVGSMVLNLRSMQLSPNGAMLLLESVHNMTLFSPQSFDIETPSAATIQCKM